MKTYSELLERKNTITEADTEDMQYAVVLKGGSIGNTNIKSARDLKGDTVDKQMKVYDDIKDAKDNAKRRNKALSPGEKKYYGLRYIIARIIDGKYTGK